MLITSIKVPLPAPDSGYLLIEPSNFSGNLNEFLPGAQPCVPPFLWAAEAYMPYLLRLDKLPSTQQDFISQLLEQETSEQYPPVICAWLQSDNDIDELANCVARFISGRDSDGKQVIWRYYDPRVFILIAHLFKDEQGHALLGMINRWTFPWRKQWWSVQRTCPFVASTDDLDLGWPTDIQWELLSKSRVFHQLHMRLHKNDLMPARCLDELNHSISAFLETANYLHLDNDEERAEFTYLSTRYRELFRTNHELIPKWIKLRSREISLRDMLTDVTAEVVKLMENRINETRRSI